jgi:hypothetical protein
MIELPLGAREFDRMLEWILTPNRIWRGGWHLVWNSKKRHWQHGGIVDIDDGPFLRYERSKARKHLAVARAVYRQRRFRLQPIGAKWIMGSCGDILWDLDHPERAEWFEGWGGHLCGVCLREFFRG